MLEVHHLKLNTLDVLFKGLAVSSHLILHSPLLVFQLRNDGVVSDVFLPQVLNKVLHLLVAQIKSIHLNMQALKFFVQVVVAVGDNVGCVGLLLFLSFYVNAPVFFVVGVLQEDAGTGVAKGWAFADLGGALPSERGLGWVDGFSFDGFRRFASSHELALHHSDISLHALKLVLHKLEPR